jgi:hypothetical protein
MLLKLNYLCSIRIKSWYYKNLQLQNNSFFFLFQSYKKKCNEKKHYVKAHNKKGQHGSMDHFGHFENSASCISYNSYNYNNYQTRIDHKYW